MTDGLSAHQNFAAVREEPSEEVYEAAHAYEDTDEYEASDDEDAYEADGNNAYEESTDGSSEHTAASYDADRESEGVTAENGEEAFAYSSKPMSELTEQFGGRHVTEDTILYGIRKEDVR